VSSDTLFSFLFGSGGGGSFLLVFYLFRHVEILTLGGFSLSHRTRFCLTLLSRSYNDGKLLRIGHVFEQLARVRETGPRPFWCPETELQGR
jgi:hypothetical protein